MLTDRHLEEFRSDGFTAVPGMFSAELDDLLRWTDELAARTPRPGREMVYFEDSLAEPGRRVLSRIEKFADPDEPFGRFVRAPRLMEAVARLLGGPAVLFKEKINFKMPGGGGFAPHQDIQPCWDDYAPSFLSVAIALDDSTIENGCLELAAGHHRRGLLGERWKPLTPEQLQGVHFVPFPMAPGDAVFFDCFVPHRSAPNFTSAPRRNLYLTYNLAADGDHRERYFADKRRSYPPDNEREPGRTYVFRV